MRFLHFITLCSTGIFALPFRQQVSSNGQDPSIYEVQQAMQQMSFFKNVNVPAQTEFLTIAMNMDTPRGELLNQLDSWAVRNNVIYQWSNFKAGVNAKKTELIASLRTMFSKLPSAFEEIIQNDNDMALSQNQALQRMGGVFAILTQGVGTALNNFVDYLFGSNGQTGNHENWIPGQNGNGFPGNNGVFPGNNNGNNNGGFSGTGFGNGNNNGNGNGFFPGGLNNNGNGNGMPGSNDGFPNNGNNNGGFSGNNNNGNNGNNLGNGQNGNNGIFPGNNNNNGFSGNGNNANGFFGNGNGGSPRSGFNGNNNGGFPGTGVFPSGNGGIPSGQGIGEQGNNRIGVLTSGPFVQNGFSRF